MKYFLNILFMVCCSLPLLSQSTALCPTKAYCLNNGTYSNVLGLDYLGNGHGVLMSVRVNGGKVKIPIATNPYPLLNSYDFTTNTTTVGYQLDECPNTASVFELVYEDGSVCTVSASSITQCPDSRVCANNQFGLHFNTLPSNIAPFSNVTLCFGANNSNNGSYALSSVDQFGKNFIYPVGYCNGVTNQVTVQLSNPEKTKCTYSISGNLCNPTSNASTPCPHLNCASNNSTVDCKKILLQCEYPLQKLVQERWEQLDGCDLWEGECGISSTISRTGKVTIGSSNAHGVSNDYQLIVCGPGDPNNTSSGILTTKYKAKNCQWCDYVFEKDYSYPSLYELDQFISANRKLPKTVSQAQVIKDKGIVLEDLTRDQQEKIEELYLHLIEMNKKIVHLENKIK